MKLSQQLKQQMLKEIKYSNAIRSKDIFINLILMHWGIVVGKQSLFSVNRTLCFYRSRTVSMCRKSLQFTITMILSWSWGFSGNTCWHCMVWLHGHCPQCVVCSGAEAAVRSWKVYRRKHLSLMTCLTLNCFWFCLSRSFTKQNFSWPSSLVMQTLFRSRPTFEEARTEHGLSATSQSQSTALFSSDFHKCVTPREPHNIFKRRR